MVTLTPIERCLVSDKYIKQISLHVRRVAIIFFATSCEGNHLGVNGEPFHYPPLADVCYSQASV